MKSQEIMCPNCEGSGCIADAGYVNCTACDATGVMSYEKVHSIFYESVNQRHAITSTERREEKLRESVRRLVGEFSQKRDEADKALNDAYGAGNYNQVHNRQGYKEAMTYVWRELSALIDGKDGGQMTKPSSVFGAMASSDYTKKHGLP